MSRQDFDFGGVRRYYFSHVDTLQNVLFVAPVLLFSVIAHEYAHGYAALRQGDSTALAMGRLTWNPLKHIDPWLTVAMPLIMGYYSNWRVMLGGAKPVPVNPANYRNLVRGDIIVSLAGVATNLVLAILATILLALFGLLWKVAPASGGLVWIVQVAMIYGVLINLSLIFFNLLPIPPLDGSHVLKYLLPKPIAIKYVQFGHFGFILLIALLFYGRGILDAWMRPATIAVAFLVGSVDSLLMPRALAWFR
jgi:Zn-dependent protease